MRRFHRLAPKVAAAVFAAAVLPLLPAHAASPFDGTWLINGAGAGAQSQFQRYECPPIHLTIDVKDGALTGMLERAYGNNVDNGIDHNATALTGSVDDKGNVKFSWQGINGSGTATRYHMFLTWQGECGPRAAVGELY